MSAARSAPNQQTSKAAAAGGAADESSDEEGHYVVDMIVGQRERSGILSYKIRWEGYSVSTKATFHNLRPSNNELLAVQAADDTWEPVEHLTHVHT